MEDVDPDLDNEGIPVLFVTRLNVIKELPTRDSVGSEKAEESY